MSVFRQFYTLWYGCLLGNLFLLAIVISMIYLSYLDPPKEDIQVSHSWLGQINSLVFPIFAFSCHNTVPDIFQVKTN